MGTTAGEQHDLGQNPAWWHLPQNQLAKLLRAYWRSNLLPRDVQLSQESNRVFTSIDREMEEPWITAKKKRVFVSASRDNVKSNEWHFEIPARSYEVWVLLCWRKEGYWLDDFVIPQGVFSQPLRWRRNR